MHGCIPSFDQRLWHCCTMQLKWIPKCSIIAVPIYFCNSRSPYYCSYGAHMSKPTLVHAEWLMIVLISWRAVAASLVSGTRKQMLNERLATDSIPLPHLFFCPPVGSPSCNTAYWNCNRIPEFQPKLIFRFFAMIVGRHVHICAWWNRLAVHHGWRSHLFTSGCQLSDFFSLIV